MQQLNATPEELLTIVQEMFPVQYDRSVAELTIRKQDELIISLTKENEALKDSVDNAVVESRHGHTHDD